MSEATLGEALQHTRRPARGTDGLPEAEIQYRDLFQALDRGFCVVEVMFDERQHPVDYVFVETNPVFESQTGLKDALGKSARTLHPTLEEHWFEIYGQVALTGEPARFEHGSAVM